METWFEAAYDRIQPVCVVKVNPATVVLSKKKYRISWGPDLTGTEAKGPDQFIEQTARKLGAYQSYFPTWEEAHAHLMLLAEANVRSVRSELDHATGRLGNIKGLKKPDAA